MSSLRDRYSFTGSERALAPRRTLKTAISAIGHGLHNGADVTLRLVPAEPGAGIEFHRTDLDVRIPARFDHVNDTRLCTVVSVGAARVGTIEHLMAALAASGVDDLVIEVDAAEVPIFDGSAAPFLRLIESAGVVAHGGLRESLEILRTVRVEQDGAFAELRPHGAGGAGFELSLAIEFAASAIGAQAYSFQLTAESFAAEIAAARTFAQAAEIEALRKVGLARGGSLENAIVVDGANILNPEGLRFADEFVRHKLLDVVGDLALAGAPICGRFVGSRTGHALNNQLLRAVFADQANYRLTRGSLVVARQLSAA
ncbi:UDP-3-O-acyl-N-acetylglucosamine deacetylase [Acidocella sp.]|uniref:UDP-3-O-acyl-N-acetylglucosamine deacetylase n=1 Tax=Acidocella sp. TaxID=50710 RepID=UPI00261A82B0|nr:UDP-3-O-acyl-N-acetylglucosamine deacetylase [Acidocella sp.]MDD2794432.1 UDP-3-O-acyl-N-acetylglucosamine deacetylase [Acidocella sp.]